MKLKTISCPLLILLLWISHSAEAADIHVPGDYTTVQQAIDAALWGDNIYIHPGVYHESIIIPSKKIFISGTAPADPEIVAATILTWQAGRGSDTKPVVTFESSVAYISFAPRLHGVTVANSTHKSGAVVIRGGCKGLVSKCVIRDNAGIGIQCELKSVINIVESIISGNEGFGIALWGCSKGYVRNCQIRGNKDSGILCSMCDTNISIYKTIITGNEAKTGGGMHIVNHAGPIINGVTIADNFAHAGSGIYASIQATVYLDNSIVAFNTGTGGGIQCEPESNAVIRYSDFYGNESQNFIATDDPTGSDGNISEDPLFGDLENGDCHLHSVTGRFNPVSGLWIQDSDHSPCIDTAHPGVGTAYEPEPNGDRSNMGGYGRTTEASKSAVTDRKSSKSR